MQGHLDLYVTILILFYIFEVTHYSNNTLTQLKFDNKEIVAQVRKDIASRNRVIEALYRDEELKDSIIAFAVKNGSSEKDGVDIFTYAIMSFVKQCYRPKFELSKDINAYLYTIAKYEWMRINKKKMKTIPEDERYDITDGYNIETSLIDRERIAELKKSLSRLDEKCRKVITLWANNLKMREIALQMVYKSEGMARKKKHECMKKLRMLMLHN